jgi:hypothetical protein
VDAAHSAGLSSGEQADVEARDGAIVIRRAVPRFTLEIACRDKQKRKYSTTDAHRFTRIRSDPLMRTWSLI